MSTRQLIIRGIVATLMAPFVASVSVAVPFAVIVFFAPEAPNSIGGLVQAYLVTVLSFAALGVLFLGFFTILFTLLTQPALTLFQRSRGRRRLIHVGTSSVLGVFLFWFLGPSLSGESFGPPLTMMHWQDLVNISAVGLVGGAAVGLLWDWLVLRPMFKRPITDG